jgi:hypothetical protein
MNGIQYALRRIHHGENEMTKDLLRLAETHKVEHEVHHVARDLAMWSQEHVALLAKHGTHFGLDLDRDADHPSTAGEKLRGAMSTMVGRRPEPGLMLLEHLADLYLRASDNSLAWEMLAQVAQAKHERELLDLTSECHPKTLRQLRWINTTIKTHSPQILSSL